MISLGEYIPKVTSLEDIQNYAVQRLIYKLKQLGVYDEKMTISQAVGLLKDSSVFPEAEFKQLKNSMPKLYCYYGTFLSEDEPEKFPGSDSFFIDIDTSYYTDDIINNIDNVFKKARYIRYAQRSLNNKLHFICNFGKVVKTVEDWTKHTITYTIFILDQLKDLGYDFFKLQDEIITYNESNQENGRKSDIIDTHNMKWTQRFFSYPYKFLVNKYQCPAAFSLEEDFALELKDKYPYYFIDTIKTNTNPKTTKTNSKHSSEFIPNDYFNKLYEYEIVENPKQFDDTEFYYEFRRKIYGALVKITNFNEEESNKLWKIVCSHYNLNVRHPMNYYINDNLKNYFNYWTKKESKYCLSINAERWLCKYGILVTNKNDEVIKIPSDKFLSDYNSDIIYELEKYGKVQVVAPTGSGKTVSITGLAKELKAIVLVPYLATNSLYSKDLHLITSPQEELSDDEAYVMVFDQGIKRLPCNRTIILDESHTVFMERDFREREIVLINQLKNQNKVLLFTATPCNELELIGGKRVMEFSKYHNKVFTTFLHYDETGEKFFNIQRKIEDLFIGNSKYDRIVVMDDMIVKRLYELYSPIFKEDILYFRANTRTNKDCQEMLNEEILKKKLTLCTRAGFNGLNFKNTNEKILLISSLTIPQIIIQQAGRFRNIDVYLNIYVNDNSTLENEDNLDYFKEASEYSIATGSEFIIQNPQFDNEEFYIAKKQIVQYMNENSTYDVVKEYLKKTGYFTIGKDYNIRKIKGIKKDNTAKEISLMIKNGENFDVLPLNDVQYSYYKRFKEAIDDFCKKYNIASPLDSNFLENLYTRDSKWCMRLINSFDNQLLIDSIIDKIENIISISTMDNKSFEHQIKLANDWISSIAKIPNLKVKTNENKNKIKHILEIREENYGDEPLKVMDNIIIINEEKKNITNKKKNEGQKKGGKKGKEIIIINLETNEELKFQTKEECIKALNINIKALNKIIQGQKFKNKKELNKYAYKSP